jgi:hypothetical protein
MSEDMKSILNTIHIYRGDFHKGMIGWRVVVGAVLRGEESLTDEREIGELRDGDRLEVRPVVEGRLSFVSYDAEVGDLEATGEVWSQEGVVPFLDLGRHEPRGGSEGERGSGTCLDMEAATFHANRIAKTELCIETLETRHSDRLDFHEVSAASVKAALIAAFAAGQDCAREQGA